MISKKNYDQAFVWIFLPEQSQPVVAGKLQNHNGILYFNYGKSYLERINDKFPAISIYDKELPLRKGLLAPLPGLSLPNCIRDSAPDAWGRRVILNRIFSANTHDSIELSELTYLLLSGSDRVGVLDFQLSATEYVPRSVNHASLEELYRSVEKIESGQELNPQLDQALFHGSSIGGARPKAVIEDSANKYIAKFSSRTDHYNIIKAEFIAMKLAKIVGLNVAEVDLVKVYGKDILTVKRFDRCYKNNQWLRSGVISALTLLELDELMARYASYEDLAKIIRHKFVFPKKNLKELFSRLVFNILCGNTDDHARNHSAFWDGNSLTLTPAYDICPQNRSGGEASQAMKIFGDINQSKLIHCINSAENYLLSKQQAKEIIDQQVTKINSNWSEVCDLAQLPKVERNFFWQRQFLNKFIFA